MWMCRLYNSNGLDISFDADENRNKDIFTLAFEHFLNHPSYEDHLGLAFLDSPSINTEFNIENDNGYIRFYNHEFKSLIAHQKPNEVKRYLLKRLGGLLLTAIIYHDDVCMPLYRAEMHVLMKSI